MSIANLQFSGSFHFYLAMEKFRTLEIHQKSSNSKVFHLLLNRPSVSNVLSLEFFNEFPKALLSLDQNPQVAVIVLSGAGDDFCAGFNVKPLAAMSVDFSGDRGRSGERLRRRIIALQEATSAIERCRKPVIAAIHGACIGVGVDIATACDIRYCAVNAYFSVKEVDLAVTPDLGTLQRLPAIVGYGRAMELALTARRFSSSEAKEIGLVSRVFGSKADLDAGVTIIAEELSGKSPLAVTGTKSVMLKSRDLSVEQGLDYVATWNSSMVLSDDLQEALSAFLNKRRPLFARL